MTKLEKEAESAYLNEKAKREFLDDAEAYIAGYKTGCKNTTRTMLAHSIADIVGVKNEAREIIAAMLSRPDGDIKARAQKWLEENP